MTLRPTIAIIGGGLSGAAVAYHLAGLLTQAEVDVVVIEPRAELGRGLAYSAGDPDHRLNVPARRMTLRTDQLDHFQNWLAGQQDPPLPPGACADVFAPRIVFGSYVAAQLAPLLADGRVDHVRAVVTGISRPDRYALTLSNGATLQADMLVIAATHPKAALPRELAMLAGTAALIDDPLAPGALDKIHENERILIVGNGLTSADIVATLRRRGHLGHITAVSRHGWRSMAHGPQQADTTADFAQDPARTALGLLRRVRQSLADDASAGLTWHATFDRLRAQGPAIWAALPVRERRRFLRHMRALWDVHRFRIAPQTLEASLQMQRIGRLTHLGARIAQVQVGDSIDLALVVRHNAINIPLTVDRLILATGPAHSSVITGTPALSDLAALGLLQPDELHLGLKTCACGHAVPTQGKPDGSILIAGPLARATVGELMGVPEVIAWAEHIAREIVTQTRRRKARIAAE